MSATRVLLAGLFVALLPGAAIADALAVGIAPPPPAAGFEAALQHIVVEPYERGYDVTVTLRTLGTDQSATASPQVMLLGAGTLQQDCDDKSVLPVDWTAIGGRERFLPQGVADCGVGAVMQSDVLAWDAGKLRTPPSWADFWDVARQPGQRGLKRDVRPLLEIALMADGVPPGQVYATLATPQGVDRAFRKLDQIKPYIVWWTSGEDAAQLLRSGKVLMSMVPSTDALATPAAPAGAAPPPPIGVQWAQSLYTLRYWAVAASAPDPGAASRFVAFATDPERQGEMMAATHLGAPALGADAAQPAAVVQSAPSAPANLQDALQEDARFWRQNYAPLEQRFLAWLAK